MLNFRRLTLAASICLILFSSNSQQARAQDSIKNIVESHVKALGGNAAIAKIKTLQREGTVSGKSNFGPLNGSMKNTYDLTGKRTHTALDLGVYQRQTVWAGDKSWVKDSAQGFTDLPADEAAYAKFEFGISPLLMMHKEYPDGLKITGEKEVNGKKCKSITTTDSKIEFFLDPKTNLLEGLKMVGGISVIYENYKAKNGVQLADKQTTAIEAQGLTMAIDYKKTEINGKVDSGIFFKDGVAKEQKKPAPPSGVTAAQVIGFMDKDGDKQISKAEASAELKPNFGYIDTDKNGFIDVKEAKALADYINGEAAKANPTTGSSTKPKGKLTAKQVIESMDKNKDGRISKDEASEETKLFFDDIDANKDGLIDEKEAKVMADHANQNK